MTTDGMIPYFDPDNIERWKAAPPLEMLRSIVSEARRRIELGAVVAQKVLQHPSFDAVKTFDSDDTSLKELMNRTIRSFVTVHQYIVIGIQYLRAVQTASSDNQDINSIFQQSVMDYLNQDNVVPAEIIHHLMVSPMTALTVMCEKVHSQLLECIAALNPIVTSPGFETETRLDYNAEVTFKFLIHAIIGEATGIDRIVRTGLAYVDAFNRGKIKIPS